MKTQIELIKLKIGITFERQARSNLVIIQYQTHPHMLDHWARIPDCTSLHGT